MGPECPPQSIIYNLTIFRSHRTYLIFQILQLLLSITILFLAFVSQHLFRQQKVLLLQFILLLCIAVDLQFWAYSRFVVRLLTEEHLCRATSNRIDIGIFFVFLLTFGFMAMTEAKAKNSNYQGEDEQYEELMEADDIVVIAVIICRYMVQIYQLINEIKATKQNIECQKDIKDFDLNNTPYTSVMDENLQAIHDEIVKERIKAKTSRSSEEKTKSEEWDGEMERSAAGGSAQCSLQPEGDGKCGKQEQTSAS